ncbi:hypothetical protein GCM10009122_06420 [Fulvivirga kasyanovii]|uniref:DUF3137 domain-containing protein n=1 Tax=Fulvivirga kasyanovii TaxID=396812 RepID=A0ABW9RVB0_9BACT|nr:DUF3137 domain-containing protein [Fulvivirga kasyanovii]MTI27184.1 DUF3137 domain-containing protein [Fulvivirga kasyanovii]
MQSALKEELRKRLANLETFRRKQTKRLKFQKRICRILKFIYMPCLVVTVAALVFPVIFPFVIPVVVVALSLWLLEYLIVEYIFKHPDVQYRDAFKKDLVEWILRSINESFIYKADQKIPQQKIEQAQIFDNRIDDYRGEDHIQGNISGVEVEICEGRLFVDKQTFKSISKELANSIISFTGEVVISLLGGETGDDDGDGDNRNLIEFFNGLLMQADFNKQHSGSIHVIPIETSKNWFVSKSLFHGKGKVEMDNEEFNKVFSTYTTGELEAHYVLSPKLMQALLEINSQVKGGIYIAFSSGKLFFGIDWKKDLFEADFNKPLTSETDVEYIVSQINFFEILIKQLALDRKIWNIGATA